MWFIFIIIYFGTIYVEIYLFSGLNLSWLFNDGTFMYKKKSVRKRKTCHRGCDDGVYISAIVMFHPLDRVMFILHMRDFERFSTFLDTSANKIHE